MQPGPPAILLWESTSKTPARQRPARQAAQQPLLISPDIAATGPPPQMAAWSATRLVRDSIRPISSQIFASFLSAAGVAAGLAAFSRGLLPAGAFLRGGRLRRSCGTLLGNSSVFGGCVSCVPHAWWPFLRSIGTRPWIIPVACKDKSTREVLARSVASLP